MSSTIKKAVLLIVVMMFSNLTALDLCKEHFSEIDNIKDKACSFTLEAHKNGGYLFRSSFVLTPYELAMHRFKSKFTYSEFSETFRDLISYCKPEGIGYLYTGYTEVTDDFYNLYTECIAKHQGIHARYERGKIYFDRGLYEDCLNDIHPIINSEDWDKSNLSIEQQNQSLLTKGQALLEGGVYDEAITTLSDLIKRDPKNKAAYFNRALAYFETGLFDNALSDYLISEKSKVLSSIKLKTSTDFQNSLLNGLTQGGIDSAKDFFPSLWNSTYGLGESLWSFAQHPLNSTNNFCNACYDIGEASAEYFKTLDWNRIEGYAIEIQRLCEKFDYLSDAEKGHLIGYSIGKYGVDFFAGSTFVKGAMALKKLKNANRICNLEAMAISQTNKETIVASALEHSSQRNNYFKNVKIHWDKQNKHIPGMHNYEEGKGIITLSKNDITTILKERAGTGHPVNANLPGSADYRERIDLGRIVGEFIYKENGIERKVPTTKIIIHYDSNGFAHMRPGQP